MKIKIERGKRTYEAVPCGRRCERRTAIYKRPTAHIRLTAMCAHFEYKGGMPRCRKLGTVCGKPIFQEGCEGFKEVAK